MSTKIYEAWKVDRSVYEPLMVPRLLDATLGPLDRRPWPPEIDSDDRPPQVALLADPSDPAGDFYAIGYCLTAEQLAAIDALDGWADHRYWDNVDQPDDVPEAEWDARRATWDRVLGGSATGLSYAPSSAVGAVWRLDDMHAFQNRPQRSREAS